MTKKQSNPEPPEIQPTICVATKMYESKLCDSECEACPGMNIYWPLPPVLNKESKTKAPPPPILDITITLKASDAQRVTEILWNAQYNIKEIAENDTFELLTLKEIGELTRIQARLRVIGKRLGDDWMQFSHLVV